MLLVTHAPVTPLLRPKRYFAERELNGLHVLGVVMSIVLVWPIILVYGIGLIFVVHLEANTRDIDALIWAAMHSLVGQLIVSALAAWVVIGVLLHVGSWFGGGEHGVPPSFAVAAWGMVPDVVGSIIGLIALYIILEPTTVTARDTATGLGVVNAQIQTVQPGWTILTVVTTGWAVIIWRYGLEYTGELTGSTAWMVAGLVAAVVAVGALV